VAGTFVLIALAALLIGLVWPRTPPKKPLPKARKAPAHPWASTIRGDFDDFAGPQNPYGPGTAPPEDEK
jgi:hypothetical protein